MEDEISTLPFAEEKRTFQSSFRKTLCVTIAPVAFTAFLPHTIQKKKEGIYYGTSDAYEQV